MSTPRWDLLPHDPLGFFGLAPGFDRKDLKRSYNGLIREFKPEKFPDEFQRIRAAYEAIEQQLRYGREATRPPQNTYQWTESTAPPNRPTPADIATPAEEHTPTSQPAQPPQPVIKSIPERLETESPQALYAELKQKTVKSPYDFFALAVLSDLVQRDDRLIFVKWLLMGLKQHPREQGLLTLLHAYLQQGVADTDCRPLLLALAKVVSDDSYYFLTERLWDQALRCLDFNAFQALLQECEGQLNDHRIRGKVVLYAHILRAALWKAPREWVEQVFAFLNSNGEYVTHHLEYDVELTSRVWEYYQARHTFLNGSDPRRRIDQAIEQFCTQEPTVGERAVIECQSYLAGNVNEVFRAFANCKEFPDELRCWAWISEEIVSRYGLADDDVDPKPAAERIVKMLREFDKNESNLRWQGFLWIRNLSYVVASLAVLYWLPMLVGYWLGYSTTMVTLYIVSGIASEVGFWLWGRHRTITPMLDRLRERMVLRSYLGSWRPSVARFFAATHLGFDQFLQISQAVIRHNSEQFSISTWIPLLVSRDGGMLVLSLAQRYLT